MAEAAHRIGMVNLAVQAVAVAEQVALLQMAAQGHPVKEMLAGQALLQIHLLHMVHKVVVALAQLG